mmetsp:Transcript_9905/g.21559  ORF Transcript_9905/g.21559 Transcript_9905/m.21559 type:complete len:318 (+) Transcript_9905:534-1487(+)
MAARQTGETRWQSFALSKSIGFGKDAWFHLTQQEVGECGRVGLIFGSSQRSLTLCGTVLRRYVSSSTFRFVALVPLLLRKASRFRALLATTTLTIFLAVFFFKGIIFFVALHILLRSRQLRKRWRRGRRESNARFRVHQTQREGGLDPILFGRTTAGVVRLERFVALHGVTGDAGAGMQMALQQVHSGIVNGRNRRGIVHRTTFPGPHVCIRSAGLVVAMRASDTNLSDMNGFTLSLGRCCHIFLCGRKHFHTMLSNKAVQGCQPILVRCHGQGKRFGEGRKGSSGEDGLVRIGTVPSGRRVHTLTAKLRMTALLMR